jgi:2-oxoisovalerate dehydrogenase E2 component (dihydrolipoyl transacylase)
MTSQVFVLPDLGEGLTEAEIVAWRVAVGDVIEVDQSVVEVETAKAVVEVPCPFAGRVVELHGAPGETRPVGQPLITVEPVTDAVYREEERAGSRESSGNVLVGYGTGHGPGSRRRRRAAVAVAPAAASATAASASTASATTASATAASASTAAVADAGPAAAAPLVISPLVRRLARDHRVDVAGLHGSGPGGIVRRADVEAAIALPPSGVPPAGDRERVTPLRGVRKAVAEKLSRSRREIPDVTIWVDADATPLLEARASINEGRPDQPVSVLALLARACLSGIRRYPELNARVEEDRIVQSAHVHLGVAAQTDRGLIVPVIADAHALTTAELSAALAETTVAARAGTLPPARLTGGTFTLNNYGVFGVDGSTPIINLPEAALVGIGRIVDKPWVVDGQLSVRKVVQLTLTFDHRVCDGGVAGGFLRHVADCVERPALLI